MGSQEAHILGVLRPGCGPYPRTHGTPQVAYDNWKEPFGVTSNICEIFRRGGPSRQLTLRFAINRVTAATLMT
jgi:hypothetical protein